MPALPVPRCAYPTDAVRTAERAAVGAAPPGALMQRAAAALASTVLGVLTGSGTAVHGARVVLLVGSSDNGGDALHAGARLVRRGAAVTALLTGGRAHAGGLSALRAAGGRVRLADGGDVSALLDESRAARGRDEGGAPPPGSVDEAARALLAGARVVVDGMLGTGGSPGLRGAAAELAALLRAAPRGRPVVVAVDVPSGVDTGTGELPGDSVRADLTVTMGAAKPALLLPPARAAAGVVTVVDIGLDAALLGEPAVRTLDGAAAAAAWPVPAPGDDKYSRGVLGIVAGGDSYTGAALLCTGAAVRSGAGMVRFAGGPHPAELIRARWPEVVTGTGRVQAWVAGPGLDLGEEGSEDAARAALRECLERGIPLLLDSGALPLLENHVREHGPLDPARNPALLTPHAGEAVSILRGVGAGSPSRAEVEARPLHHARAAALATGATVLLKGAATVVAEPGGSVWAQDDGPHWLATAGSGDVLAGIAGVLLAAGLRPGLAGALAACVHGRAARAANPGGPIDASSVHEAVPGVVAGLLREGGRVTA